MKVAVSALFAALSLTVAASAFAQQGAKDCSKTSRPALCQALNDAEAACKDKATREEQKACVKEKLKTPEAPKK